MVFYEMTSQRHYLVLTDSAAVRHMCMNQSKVAKYFEALDALLQKTGLGDKPNQIWNMDETGIQLEHKPHRVLAQKGTRFLHARTSGNRETITVVACASAAGEKLPPHVIARGKTRKTLNGFEITSAPKGTSWSVSPSGWTRQGIVQLWFEKSFLPNIGKERPQILILDGHDSHNFIELISSAIENQIEIVELPAHTSHWLQPCDRTLFKPLKDAYNGACQELMNRFPGSVIGRSNFCSLFSTAWTKAMTADNIKSGFRACGIYPLNPGQIPEAAYLPSTLYAAQEHSSTDIIAAEQNGETSNPQAESESNEQINSNEPASVAVADSENDAEVSLISNIDVSQLLEVEDMNISNMSITFDEITTEAEQPNVCQPVDAVTYTCPDDLALCAVELAIQPEKLIEYKAAYDRNTQDHFSDPIYMTWKSLKDKISNKEIAAVEDQADLSLTITEPGPTQSTPASVSVAENPDVEKEAKSASAKVLKPVSQINNECKLPRPFTPMTDERQKLANFVGRQCRPTLSVVCHGKVGQLLLADKSQTKVGQQEKFSNTFENQASCRPEFWTVIGG